MGMVYAEEIEGAVLGACLLERSAQAVVLKSLRAEMFYLTAHRVVFEAINALYARGAAVDMLTVTEELRAQGRLDDAGGPFAVAKLAAGVATSAHLEYHCGILFQYYLRRKLVEALTRELAAANDMTCDVYDVLIDTQRELGALLEDSPLENHLHPMPEVMDDTVALVDRRQELAVNGLTGVPTGLQRLNEMTGGWQPGNLIFYGGASGRREDGTRLVLCASGGDGGCAGGVLHAGDDGFGTGRAHGTGGEFGRSVAYPSGQALAGGGGGCAPYGGTDEHAAGTCRRYAVHQRRPVVCHRQVAAGKGAAGLAYRRLSATACHGESGAYA